MRVAFGKGRRRRPVQTAGGERLHLVIVQQPILRRRKGRCPTNVAAMGGRR